MNMNALRQQQIPWGIDELRRIVSHYTGQLVHGCGNDECKEPLCDTGRRNALPPYRSARTWNVRAARLIALAMANGDNPRKHLCRFYSSNLPQDDTWKIEEETPRDPSSFQQILSDTPSIRKFCAGGGNQSLAYPAEYSVWQSLAPLLEEPKWDSTIISNREAADILQTALSRLLHTLPPWTPHDLGIVNHIINMGPAFPTNIHESVNCNPWSPWLSLLDAMEDFKALRLLTKICIAVNIRARVESNIQSLRSKLGEASVLRPRPIALRTLLINGLLQNHETQDLLCLIVWLKMVFLRRWDGSPVIRDPAALGGLELIECFLNDHAADDAVASDFIKIFFAVPTVPRRLELMDVAKSWLYWNGGRYDRHILSYLFMFRPTECAQYFRAVCHLKMRAAHSRAEISVKLRQRLLPYAHNRELKDARIRHNEEHYCLLNVSRNNALRDAYDQLWQRRSGELLRPLRVRLGEIEELEIGQDLGGVQIEFFNIICKEVMDEETGMFTLLDKTTGLSYFRPGSLQPLHMFELFGVMISLAIYNGIALPVSFPCAFYTMLRHLCTSDEISPTTCSHDTLSLEILEEGWPVEARSLRSILTNEGNCDGLEYSFPMEANGLRLAVYLPEDCNNLEVTEATPALASDSISWPGWRITLSNKEPAKLDENNKAKFVFDYIHWLVMESVRPQWTAFVNGFLKVLDPRTLSIFPNPAGLRDFVEGSKRLNINELRQAARYDGFNADGRYMRIFWSVVSGWPENKQKQLLKFVTAAERIPIGGPSNITFIIQRADAENDERLPTSSTCFGTLMLPKYKNAEVLDRKLSLAIEYGLEGFGTG